MPQYASDLDDYPELLKAAALWKGVAADVIEKDYFLCRALHALFTEAPGDFVLKGGTSLSKGWGVIDRFSEDIDLLFVDDGGAQVRDRRMKEAIAVICRTPGFAFLRGRTPARRGVHRDALFAYAARAARAAGIGEYLLLEMGIRGVPVPAETRPVQSFLTDYCRAQRLGELAEDLAPFPCRVLDLRRTFVEKLFVAHAMFADGFRHQKARHYYDLACLCARPEVRDFAGSDMYLRMLGEVRENSTRWFHQQPVFPDARFAGCSAFKLDQETLGRLVRLYAEERDLFFAEPPPMNVLLDAIGTLLPQL